MSYVLADMPWLVCVFISQCCHKVYRDLKVRGHQTRVGSPLLPCESQGLTQVFSLGGKHCYTRGHLAGSLLIAIMPVMSGDQPRTFMDLHLSKSFEYLYT